MDIYCHVCTLSLYIVIKRTEVGQNVNTVQKSTLNVGLYKHFDKLDNDNIDDNQYDLYVPMSNNEIE